MTKYEFINELRRRIHDMPIDEIDKTVYYYSECIDDRVEEGMTEEEAVRALGNMDDIVNNIMLDMPLHQLVMAKVKKTVNSDTKKMWMIIAIATCWIWVPIAIGLLGGVFGLLAGAAGIIVALFAVFIGLLVGGFAAILGALVNMHMYSAEQILLAIGGGLICISLGLMLYVPVKSTVYNIKNGINWLFRKFKNVFIAKKEGVTE